MTIDEKSREERALYDVEEERKSEIDRLLKTIRHLENTLEEMENKEASLIVSSLLDSFHYVAIVAVNLVEFSIYFKLQLIVSF